MENPQHWMHRDRAAKPLTLSAKLAAMTAERDGLLQRLETAKGLAEALEAIEANAHHYWSYWICPWCKARVDMTREEANAPYETAVLSQVLPHKPDCQRQQRLAAWHGAKGGE